MDQNTTFRELAQAYGYTEVGSPNPYMWSYIHDEFKNRINYYYTTGTMTFQKPKKNDIKVHKRIFTDIDFEELLINNQKYEK